MIGTKEKGFRKCCGNCLNFDYGICDFNGYIVEEDDFMCNGIGWEKVLKGDNDDSKRVPGRVS